MFWRKMPISAYVNIFRFSVFICMVDRMRFVSYGRCSMSQDLGLIPSLHESWFYHPQKNNKTKQTYIHTCTHT